MSVRALDGEPVATRRATRLPSQLVPRAWNAGVKRCGEHALSVSRAVRRLAHQSLRPLQPSLLGPISHPNGRLMGTVDRAISVPFRARRLRFVTVSHGQSRLVDLDVSSFRCVAARMVTMGSPVALGPPASVAGGSQRARAAMMGTKQAQVTALHAQTLA
jgi:hypothetical protein